MFEIKVNIVEQTERPYADTVLKYKITELIEKNDIHVPKLVLLMTDLELSFVDGINLEYLFETILSIDAVQEKYIKMRSMNKLIFWILDSVGASSFVNLAYNVMFSFTDIARLQPSVFLSAGTYDNPFSSAVFGFLFSIYL